MSHRYEIHCDRVGCKSHQLANCVNKNELPSGWTVDIRRHLCQTCTNQKKALDIKQRRELKTFWEGGP